MNIVQLDRECLSYTRYLIGQDPTRDVLEHYRDFHEKSDALKGLEIDPFDRLLVEASARGPSWARLADSYASVFRKDCALRKKLVLTLALLECAPPSFEALDRAGEGGRLGAVLGLAGGAARYALTLIVSIAIFTPARLGLALASERRPAAAAER